jgi:hypothetical protein
MKNRTPIDAETRGKLRAWKRTMATRYATIDRAYQDQRILETIGKFALSGSIGRSRAFHKLRKSFGAAILEGVRLEKPVIAVWSILKPRVAVSVECYEDDPGAMQNCVCVNYVLAGDMPGDRGFCDGLWTLEVGDHALGRVLQRSPAADLSATILQAHHALLRARLCDLLPNFADPTVAFYLPAGDGVFVCEVHRGKDLSLGCDHSIWIRARTWLHLDQLSDQQERAVLVVDGIPGDRVGDDWFLPVPLKEIVEEDDGRLSVAKWQYGLPEMLGAATRAAA